MSPRTGRPLKGETKRDHRVAVKLDEGEITLLDECAARMESSRTDVIVRGIKLVKQELDSKNGENISSPLDFCVPASYNGFTGYESEVERVSPRTGRPVIGEKKDVDLKIRISQSVNERLLAYCNKHGQKRAEVVREAITEKLDKEDRDEISKPS